MDYVCGDNRFEIIERYKNELISATNIESSPDEMAVLDNILFRFWQMGWLKEQEESIPVSWLTEKLDGHPELPYAVTDGINNVLDLWEGSVK